MFNKLMESQRLSLKIRPYWTQYYFISYLIFMRKLAKLAAGVTTVIAAIQALAITVAAQSYDWTDWYSDYADTAAQAATVGILGSTTVAIVVCCVAIVGFGINIALAYFVYRDATKNKVDSPILWALLTFFLTLIGLLIYLLAIRPEAIRKMQGAAPTNVQQ
jgi:hypothetical protein